MNSSPTPRVRSHFWKGYSKTPCCRWTSCGILRVLREVEAAGDRCARDPEYQHRQNFQSQPRGRRHGTTHLLNSTAVPFIIRGETVDLGSTEARQLIVALAQEAEEILSVDHIKRYFGFTDADIAELSQNVDLERAVSSKNRSDYSTAARPAIKRGLPRGSARRFARHHDRPNGTERVAYSSRRALGQAQRRGRAGPRASGYQGRGSPIFIITVQSPRGQEGDRRRAFERAGAAPDEPWLQPIIVITREPADDAGSQFAISEDVEVDSVKRLGRPVLRTDRPIPFSLEEFPRRQASGCPNYRVT